MTTTVLSFQSILPINVEISCIPPFHVKSWKAEKISSFLTKSQFQDSLLSQFPSFWWLCRMSLTQNLFGVFLIIGGMLDLGLKTAVLGCQSQHNCRTRNISSLFILPWLSGRGRAWQFSPLLNCVPAPTFQLYFKKKVMILFVWVSHMGAGSSICYFPRHVSKMLEKVEQRGLKPVLITEEQLNPLRHSTSPSTICKKSYVQATLRNVELCCNELLTQIFWNSI